jgi:hypothetical protein
MPRIATGAATTSQMAEIAGVSAETVRNWRRQHMLPAPSVDPSPKGGREATYGTIEIMIAAVLGACMAQGVSRGQLAWVSKQLIGEIVLSQAVPDGFEGAALVDVASQQVAMVRSVALGEVLGTREGSTIVVPLRVGAP